MKADFVVFDFPILRFDKVAIPQRGVLVNTWVHPNEELKI